MSTRPALTLTRKPRRPEDGTRFLTSPAEAPAAGNRPRVVGASPEPPRPTLELGGLQPDVMLDPAVPAPPRPYNAAEANRMELARLETEPAGDRNGRWKSFLISGLQNMGRNAQIAAASKMDNPLAYALGGFAGGGAVGAIDPAVDERREAEERKAKLREQISFDLSRQKAEADVEDQRSQSELRREQAKKLRTGGRTNVHYIERRDGVYEVSDENPEGRKIAGIPAEAGERGTTHYFEREDGVYGVNDANRQGFKISGVPGKPTNEKDVKIPDTFYRGKDDNRIKNDAMAEVLSKPEYHTTGMRPDVVNAYGGDMKKIQAAIRNGDLTPGELFTDPSTGAMFKRDLAATYSRKAGDAQEFDSFLTMNSREADAPELLYSDYQAMFKKYKQEMQRAKPSQRDAIRRKFEQWRRRRRLAGG